MNDDPTPSAKKEGRDEEVDDDRDEKHRNAHMVIAREMDVVLHSCHR